MVIEAGPRQDVPVTPSAGVRCPWTPQALLGPFTGL